MNHAKSRADVFTLRRDASCLIRRGLLCLKAGARRLAQGLLTQAVRCFSQLDRHRENFIAVLLQLGRSYVQQRQLDYGRGCYEWALLLAIGGGLLEGTYPPRQLGPRGGGAWQKHSCFFSPGQLTASRHLCQLYERECPDQGRCIRYNQHQVRLLRTMRAPRQEAESVEALSRRYLSLGTERCVSARKHTRLRSKRIPRKSMNSVVKKL